jgi:hypothetical protein
VVTPKGPSMMLSVTWPDVDAIVTTPVKHDGEIRWDA